MPDSQRYACTRYDWRVGSYAVKFEPRGIPERLEEGLVAFLGKSGIRTGSFGLVEDENGHHWLLECHQDGAWGQLDSPSMAALPGRLRRCSLA